MKKRIFFLSLITMGLFSQQAGAQNCPAISGWSIVQVSSSGGNCTYRVDFTMTVNGSNKSVQVLVDCGGTNILTQCIGVNSGLNGAVISSNTFVCGCVTPKSLVFNSFTNGSCGGASCTTTGNVLPLHLLSFTLQPEPDKNCLNWTSAAESQLHTFDVQYSTDGIHFASIGSVAPLNIPGDHSYQYCDLTKRETGFYRLQIFNNDGSFTYSGIVLYKRNAGTGSIFPNPVHEMLWTDLARTDLLQKPSYHIIAPDGRVSASGVLTGNGINVSSLPAGIYQLRVFAAHEMLLQRSFIKN